MVGECSSLPDAENHRRDIIREISKKISAIQNANLGEHRVRELNDEINKLQRTRHYWEGRIKELGGADFKATKTKQYIDIEGKELPGTRGYKYYGVAKDLPGVRELFAEGQADHVKSFKKSRRDLYAKITPDYYGYRDDISGTQGKTSEHQLSAIEQKESEMELYWKNSLETAYHGEKKRKMEDILRSGGMFAGDTQQSDDSDGEDLEAFDEEMRVRRSNAAISIDDTA